MKEVYDEQNKLDLPNCWIGGMKIIKQQLNLEKYSDEEIAS